MLPAASIAQQTFVTAAPAVSANLYYAADESHKQVRTCRSSQLQQPAAALYLPAHQEAGSNCFISQKVMAVAASSTRLKNCKDNSDPAC